MGRKYSMKAVAKLTGLTPDTIRVWERRYEAVTPSREATGRRYYSDEEVERLLLLREASDLGMPIRRTSRMENSELRELVEKAPAVRTPDPATRDLLDRILESLDNYDSVGLDRLLASAISSMTPQELTRSVFFPLLSRVGDRWFDGQLSVAQEHLISGRLRSLTGVLMHYYPLSSGDRCVCFATPSGERHEFGILFCCWLASLRGWRCLYLGPDLPAAEIATAARAAGCEIVALSVVYKGEIESRRAELRTLRALLPADTDIWVGGSAAADIIDTDAEPGAFHTGDIDAFIRRLELPAPAAGPGARPL